jgi:hypothetical protein
MGMVLVLKQREVAQNYPMTKDYVVKANRPCWVKSPGILALGIVLRMLILRKETVAVKRKYLSDVFN